MSGRVSMAPASAEPGSAVVKARLGDKTVEMAQERRERTRAVPVPAAVQEAPLQAAKQWAAQPGFAAWTVRLALAVARAAPEPALPQAGSPDALETCQRVRFAQTRLPTTWRKSLRGGAAFSSLGHSCRSLLSRSRSEGAHEIKQAALCLEKRDAHEGDRAPDQAGITPARALKFGPLL